MIRTSLKILPVSSPLAQITYSRAAEHAVAGPYALL